MEITLSELLQLIPCTLTSDAFSRGKSRSREIIRATKVIWVRIQSNWPY